MKNYSGYITPIVGIYSLSAKTKLLRQKKHVPT